MPQLERYEFKCPFCGESKVTFITAEKLAEVKAREKLMQEIFSPACFDSTYREIFISKICSSCQGKTFGNPTNENDYFDVPEDAKTDALEAKISDMYENTRE